MMASYLTLLLVRLVLPGALLFCIALRPFGLSMIYLLLYLLAPIVQVPTNESNFKGIRGKFLLLVVVMSVLLLLLHVTWHSVLAAFAPYGSLLTNYPLLEKIGHNIGFVSYSSINPWAGVHYLAPELVMTATSIVIFLAVKRLMTPSGDGTEIRKKDEKFQQFPMLTSAGKYLCLLLIMCSGILRPSVTSGIYFLVFMGTTTAWSLGRPLEKGFAVVGRCVMAIMGVHVAVLLVYQNNWINELLPPDVSFARYFGLTKLVNIKDSEPNSFSYEANEPHMWPSLASPLVILVTYFALAVETRELFKPKMKKKSALTGLEGGKLNGSLIRGVSFHRASTRTPRDKWITATKKARMTQVAFTYISSKTLRGNASETTPLIRSKSPKKQWSSIRSASLTRQQMHQDSTGSVIIPDDAESLGEQELTLLDDIISAVIDLFQVLIRSSYIATTIIMMTWSIMYHSWLTFVLLMWANIVWLRQNQRSFMLKTSPILVVYAMMLLIAQYIYGMDLTESELPSNVTAVNMKQIGLVRPETESCIPLLIKSLFTCMFWVTLRQRVQEMRDSRHSAVIADMAAPLHLTVSTAASVISGQHEEESKSRLLRAFGVFLRAACARYWIYVVVIMLFVIGVTGERMTIFRIIYMFLFLAFILMFQISWYWWRRLMYVFWVVVIIYSMINLNLIYVYQFDNFSKIIQQYLFINEILQHDLGLEPYDPADLFVKLLTPTLFLIITIMQVHYFHKDFMMLSDPKTRTNSIAKDVGSSRRSQGGASTMKDDIPPLPAERDGNRPPTPDADNTLTEASGEMSSFPRQSKTPRSQGATTTRGSVPFKTWLKMKFQLLRGYWAISVETLFIYLDIHLIKIVMIALMLLCVFNVCAIHVPIMVIICPALLMDRHKQRICVIIISILISVYFMAKMVYQIDYITHSHFDIDCDSRYNSSTDRTVTFNNAEWLGFVKASSSKPLVALLKGYIGLIAVFTFHSLVVYRQKSKRELNDLSPETSMLMFPEVTRKEADKDLVYCAKYLFNYGFYKFGVEITLICMMGVIGSRMDAYAVIYATWLLVLVSVRRATQARLWWPFTLFLTIAVPLQYLVSVGILPQLCVEYPWSGIETQMKHIRNWLFLPYAVEPPHAFKLVFDYFLLLFATLQLHVFRIEKTRGDSYPGGSNSEDIGQEWETLNFVNPVPDFLGFVGTWLDVVKRMVFLGMLWVTLAIMFMTGTNRVNLFSMGYLIGSFIFLWQGTDFYLLPKDAILQWWSWLLRYNVSIVVIKTLLQIPGCIFGPTMQEHACWLVQLLGIGCVDKFAGGNIARFIKMDYIKVMIMLERGRSLKDAACSVPQEDIGLAWDGVCFAFLILQQRLFHSYYFFRVIDESKATTILASRGAELIEGLRQKQMKLQEDQEVKILEKIKIKMERIKANQRKIQGVLAKDPKHHDREEEEESESGTARGSVERVPLVRGDSDTSRRGYHTPASPSPPASPTSPRSPRGFHTPLSEASAPPSPARSPPPAFPPPPPPPPAAGPPSPSSALMTASLSLDAYLEPRRISFESPPSSELLPRAQSPEESYPVFSPPPIRRRHTVASPSLLQRTSLISQSSRSEPKSHHTSYDCPPYRTPRSHQRAVRSGDYYMFEEFDDVDDAMKPEEKDYEDVEAPKEMGLGKLLSTVLKTDLKRAMEARRASAPAVPAVPAVPASPQTLSRVASRQSRGHPTRHTSSLRETSRDPDFGLGLAAQPSAQDRRDRDQDRDGEDQKMSDIDDLSAAEEKETWFDKLRRYLDTAWAFVDSLLVSIARQLMKYSRDYRYVSRTLTMEKKVLKEKQGFGIGLREGSQMRWEPLPEMLNTRRKLSDISVPEIRILAPSMERGLDASPSPQRSRSRSRSPATDSDSDSPSLQDDDDTSEHESAFSLQTTSSKEVSLLHDDSLAVRTDRASVVHLLYAVWYTILAHTDIVCYIMVFINQIQSATILSIPLPLMVFTWGTLTIPRPTKTFWVTLIAYTEVIVLIKSMFQFEILPWNQKAIPANLPFTAPRIIGIERKVHYALYDLLLLLIIFLHRFMLKSLGLWKESTLDIELREDMEFPLDPEDTQMLVEGRGADVGKKYIKLHDKTGPDNEELDEDKESVNENSQIAQLDIAGPSKPPEDDHFNVHDDQEPIIAVTTTMEDPYAHYPEVIWLSLKRHLRPTRQFFQRMLAPTARVTADVYAYMFLCDFFNFLVVIFGFAAFGTHQGDGGVQAYLEENKVPMPFLVMLILQFALIVIDRALYLRKFILGKILFQYALIVGVHIWMFFILPFITERTFNTMLPPPMWYMIKCIYLLLSAYQIRCGYPRRIIGNFLCKSYRFLNMICFRAFMAVPFVFELRTLMDWIWTDTSMNLMDWLKMEDIFASVFLLKCSRYVEDEFPQPRGMKKSSMSKYLLGGGVLAFVIAVIWFPLVFFAFGNTVGEPNPPTDVTVKIRLGPYLPVYQMSAQSHNIAMFTEQDYAQLSNMYARDRTAQTFLSNYIHNDVAVVTINPNSTMKWVISPPELQRLEEEAASNSSLKVRFTFVITHPTNAAQNPPTIEEYREVELPGMVDSQRNPELDVLYNMLTNNSQPDTWLNVKLLFPKFLKVFNKGTAKPAYQLMPVVDDSDTVGDSRLYRDVQLRLEREGTSIYWRVREACRTRDPLSSIPLNNCNMLVMYTFNDKLFPETLNFISGGGIIGLYTTFVFLASRVLRGFFSGIYTKIMFDDLPNVDRVLQLCLDIYLVREALELALEEDLFAKLVFLYRSPETMIKWSRPKEETEEQQQALPAAR